MTSEDFGFRIGDRVRFTGDMSSPEFEDEGGRYSYCGIISLTGVKHIYNGMEGTVCGNECSSFRAEDGSGDRLWGIPVLFDGFRIGHTCDGQVENIDPNNSRGGWYMDPVFLEKIEEDVCVPDVCPGDIDAFLSRFI